MFWRRITRVLLLGTALTAGAASAQPQPETEALYQAGAQALRDGRHTQARSTLAQVVLLDPNFVGAWLDLALAAQADGDTPAAEEFLAILESRFTLPQRMVDLVAGLRQRIALQSAQAPQAANWRWRGQVQLGAGYDSNANTGLSITQLALTFQDGVIALPLDVSLRPQGDRYASVGLSFQGLSAAEGGEVESWLNLRTRRNARVTDFDVSEAQVGLGWIGVTPLPGHWGQWLPGPRRYALQLQHLQLGGRSLLTSASLKAQHVWTGWSCSPQASVELELRNFSAAPNLASRLHWLGASANCPGLWAQSGGRFQAQLRTGLEAGRTNSPEGRPGGDTRQHELTLGHGWSWAGTHGLHRLEAQAQWLHASDSAGYSPLLDANAHRQVHRRTAALAYTMPLSAQSMITASGASTALASGWVATFTWQAYRQQANLGLFASSGRQLQLSLQRGW